MKNNGGAQSRNVAASATAWRIIMRQQHLAYGGSACRHGGSKTSGSISAWHQLMAK